MGRKKSRIGARCSPYVPVCGATAAQLTCRRARRQDSEARLDRMRKKRKKDRDGQGEGERELDRQLKGLGPPGADEREQGGTVIIRPDKGKGKEADTGPAEPLDPGKHINFWSEFEAGAVSRASVSARATGR